MKSKEQTLNYQNDAVVARIQKDCKLPEGEARLLFVDMLKFLFICAIGKAERISPSVMIDEAWHAFILFTRDYQEFCQDHFGRFVHHRPNRPGEQAGMHDYLEVGRNLAELEFGPLSENWGFIPADSHCDGAPSRDCKSESCSASCGSCGTGRCSYCSGSKE